MCSVTVNGASVMRAHLLGRKHLKAVIAKGQQKGRQLEKEPTQVELEDEVTPGKEGSVLPSRREVLSSIPDSAAKSLIILNVPDRWLPQELVILSTYGQGWVFKS